MSPEPNIISVQGAGAGGGTSVASTVCENCSAPVPAHYCGNCGQQRTHSVHSVWHFTREITEDLTHADSRLWRTLLALVFRPGLLTRDFLAGRRARYLPPVRLYLVMSVFFFLAMSLSEREHFGNARIDVTDNETVHDGKAAEDLHRLSPRAAEKARTDLPAAGATGVTADSELPAALHDCQLDYDGPGARWVRSGFRKSCESALRDGGRSISEVFMHNLGKAMFVFLPVLALVMKPFYRRPRRYYVEHLLLSLHNHAFIFLLLGVIALLSMPLSDSVSSGLSDFAWLYVCYYIYTSLRVVYAQRRIVTLVKLAVLSCMYFAGIALMLMLTGVYSAWTL